MNTKQEYTPNSKKELNDILTTIFVNLFYHIGFVHSGEEDSEGCFIDIEKSDIGPLYIMCKNYIYVIVKIYGNEEEILKYCRSICEWYNENNNNHSVKIISWKEPEVDDGGHKCEEMEEFEYEIRMNTLYDETDTFDSYKETDDSKLHCPF